MKTLCLIAFALLLVGCRTGARQGSSLNAEQARTVALQLANDKAFELYHCQPFHDGPPARFAQGRWVWTDREGYGICDFEAKVDLAADGSSHTVDLKLLDNHNLVSFNTGETR